MELTHLRNGATLLVYTQLTRETLMLICNYSSLKKDNNNLLKVMLDASLISQLLKTPLTKITFSASVKRRQLRLLKKFTLWKLETLHLTVRNSREVLRYKSHLMFKVTSQF